MIGLKVNHSSGLISGKTTVPGTYLLTLHASNSMGKGSATLTVTIKPNAAPAIFMHSTTVSGTVGTAFYYPITATNDPTAFSVVGMPAGLKVDSGSGVISGTPTTTGTYSLTLKATNAVGTNERTLTLTIKTS